MTAFSPSRPIRFGVLLDLLQDEGGELWGRILCRSLILCGAHLALKGNTSFLRSWKPLDPCRFPPCCHYQGTAHSRETGTAQAVSNSEGTMYAFKRRWAPNIKYQVTGKEYTPQQLSSSSCKRSEGRRKRIGREGGKSSHHGSAYFDDNQRQATKDAGAIGWSEVVRLVNEPTAPASPMVSTNPAKARRLWSLTWEEERWT